MPARDQEIDRMLTDLRTLKKLEKIEQYYSDQRFEKIADVPVEMVETLEHFRSEPAGSKVRWQAAPAGTKWGDSWMTAWFRGDVRLPQACTGRKVFLRARTGGETLFLVDGEERGVFDPWHPVVMMTKKGVGGRKYHISLEAYAGHSFPNCSPSDAPTVVERKCRTFEGVEVLLEREDVTAFVFDLRVLLQMIKVLDPNTLRRGRIVARLASVYRLVNAMPQEVPESEWRQKLFEARKYMQPLLRSPNGPTAPLMGIIGHSHIDTAWLWPISETIRKCARTFSSVLNLMDQYPEFLFIQSAPCHTDWMRSHYPGIYQRIRKAVARGNWEPNGAMWVEPDCNIPSGEALVRQLLVGQQTTREMFGYTSDTLWLPDVFGYSAALPQILKGACVDFFCTTKISWNDMTRFPYDTFVWKGIDGTPVIAHYNAIHCWPDPEALTAQWNWVQHKDIQDRRLCAFGFGDGGGGPMAEMCEVARRVEDLEGCPKARYTSVSGFMQGIRQEIHNLPAYSGELYLEFHRGTLTSIAKVKRGNRKAELSLREVEFLSTLAALRGAKYPAEKLSGLWKTLLTNQFHDILPGSSIAAVNDEAVRTFGELLGATRWLTADAARSLAGAPTKASAGRQLIFNSLSWDRDGELLLDGVTEGMYPSDTGIRAQWVEDVEGKLRLAVGGFSVPALGAALLELTRGHASGGSAFKTSANTVETPHAIVRFDNIGRITSLVDKASGRQVVKPGGQLNTFLVGEDIPEQWDNWDIDSDQHMKMRIEDRLVSRKVAANGPLQLRIRGTYRIGEKSTLVQDIVFHADTPRIDFECVVDWAEKHRLFKAEFELDVLTDFARHEIQYGHAERPTHRNQVADRAKFEVCAHKWTDLSENGFGVALLNDCKYGVSVLGGTLGLTLMKSGTHPDPRGDEGRHLFTYALLPHTGGFSVESVVRPAYELNVPTPVAPAGPQARGINSLIAVDAPNVIVEAVKWAEEGKAFVARLYEAGKTGCHTNITVNAPVKSVSQTNLLEEQPEPIGVKDNWFTTYFRPFEIKTLLFRL
jgi:alpha-mannosidase